MRGTLCELAESMGVTCARGMAYLMGVFCGEAAVVYFVARGIVRMRGGPLESAVRKLGCECHAAWGSWGLS